MQQEWNREFGVVLCLSDFRKFSGTVEASALRHPCRKNRDIHVVNFLNKRTMNTEPTGQAEQKRPVVVITPGVNYKTFRKDRPNIHCDYLSVEDRQVMAAHIPEMNRHERRKMKALYGKVPHKS